jgi:hypothetical protein
MKKEVINYKKERIVLSEVLPYETPVIFSNRGFYNFLIENRVKTKGGNINWGSNKLSSVYEKIFKFAGKNKQRTIPFSFKIAHKSGSYRELSVIHPVNQIFLVEFYSKYKDVIKYFCSKSKFSIRKPVKVAKYRFINDFLHRESKNAYENFNNIELRKENTEHLKSFFVYEKYSFIYKFFESNQFHRCEKKYQELYKIDISKCFDSIYTHSIVWSIYDKQTVKDNMSSSEQTFAGKLDKLMQDMNYGETNGILIGSEIARIVAEILLQQIDEKIYSELNESFKHKQDYEIFRYVDDYFIFSKNKKTRKKIVEVICHQLKSYKLYINESKSVKYKKPIITGLSIAKHNVSNLINEQLSIRFQDKDEIDENKKEWSVSFNSKKAITIFKIIIREAGIDYSNILNYTVSIIERKYMHYIMSLEKVKNKEPYLSEFVKFNVEIIKFLFFIYSVAPRVSSTIKVVSILSKAIDNVKKLKDLDDLERDFIFKYINNEIIQILEENQLKEYTENETLYLIIVLKELGNRYLISEEDLKSYLNMKNTIKSLNYFTITTILYYIADHPKYLTLKNRLVSSVINTFKNEKRDNLNINTEYVLLLLDLISCPYIDIKYKKQLLIYFSVTDTNEQMAIINDRKNWFIKWKDFNLANEMEMKKSQEVYS